MTIHSGLLRPRLAPTYPLYLHALPSLCIRIRKSRRCLLLTQRLPASRISSISTRALLDLVSNTVRVCRTLLPRFPIAGFLNRSSRRVRIIAREDAHVIRVIHLVGIYTIIRVARIILRVKAHHFCRLPR